MNHTTTSGRHVGAKARVGAEESFEDKLNSFVVGLRVQQGEGARAENEIAARHEELGYGV